MKQELSKQVDAYIEKHDKHRSALAELRELIREYPFEETVKWGMPTYVYRGRNLLGIGAFKNHLGLWFFQGALLKDPKGLLRNAQEGKTKAMRQVTFTADEEIPREDLAQLIEQTLENQDKGLYVKLERKSAAIAIPSELAEAFLSDPDLKVHFEELSPGKRREYAEYIGSAKREDTRMSRLSKAIPMIKAGQGLHDKYKKC